MPTLAIQQNTLCDHSFIVEGQVQSAGPNSLVDKTKNWPINLWKGQTVTIWSGKGIDQVVKVTANDHNTLFLDHAWAIVPDVTSLYRGFIHSNRDYCLKCNGADSYKDISFIGGAAKTLSGIFKLAQSVEFSILTPLGGSIFNPEIGSGAELVITAEVDDDEEIQMFIQNNVERCLNTLINVQQAAFNILSFENGELLGQIKDISVIRSSDLVTLLSIRVEVVALSGDQNVVTAPLNQR